MCMNAFRHDSDTDQIIFVNINIQFQLTHQKIQNINSERDVILTSAKHNGTDKKKIELLAVGFFF